MKQFTFIATFFLSALIIHPAWAQACIPDEETQDGPVVCATLYLIPETEACRPNGYEEECNKWKIDQFIKYARQKRLKPVFSRIPPEHISLEHLTEAIILYSNRCSIESSKQYCMKPGTRKSVVLLIETNLKDSLPVSISRLNSDYSNLPPYSRSGTLQNSGRWLNHQRADAFLPKKNIKWELKIGNYNTWSLGTQE